ncbi:hypothetical protein B0H14DRAFT_2765488 [Mycena olivaceomarginata]|nr:hypothetical protein B0H14DRAFT_2765488 [Mycena olivaceomarginata]
MENLTVTDLVGSWQLAMAIDLMLWNVEFDFLLARETRDENEMKSFAPQLRIHVMTACILLTQLGLAMVGAAESDSDMMFCGQRPSW